MDARELKDKATAALAGKKFAKGAELLEEYCKSDQKDVQARLRCGDAWAKAGKKEKAVTAYAWAAEGFAREGFLPRAIAASKLVLELDPTHKAVQKMLADLYARKSSSPSRIGPAPASAGPDLPQLGQAGDVSRNVEQPTTPEAYKHRPDAIDLDAPAPVRVQRPTQPTTAPAQHRPDAIDVPEFELPIEHGRASVGGMAAETGPSPATREDAIEIDLGEPTTAPPKALEAIEIEIPIEGVPLDTQLPQSGLDPAVLAVLKPPPTLPPPTSRRVELDPSPLPQPAPVFELEVELPPPAPASAPPALIDEATPFQSSPSARIRLPTGFTPPKPVLPPAPPSVDTDLARSLGALTQSTSRPSGIHASFTELELESDSLLHAVEAAAATAPAPGTPVEEEILEAEPVDDFKPGVLPKIPLFSDLPEDAFIALFERCPLRRMDEGALIIEQGQRGDAFYVICAGRVRVFRNDNGQRLELASLEEGAFFGEVALLSESPRTASVEAAAEDTQVLEISAPILKELSAKHPTVAQALKKFCRQRLLSNLMASAALFRPFSRSDRRDLIQRFRAREVKAGEQIVKEGADSDGLYVVLSGEVEVRVKGSQVTALREGEIFGEMSLLTKTPAAASVVARRHTSLLRLPRADFDALVLSHPQILEHVADLTDARRKSNQHLV